VAEPQRCGRSALPSRITEKERLYSNFGKGLQCFGVVFEEDGAEGGDAGAYGEKGVAEDAEDPGLEVGVLLKGVEGTEGFGEGLLHGVFGFGMIAGKPMGAIVERGEERERELLEGCVAVDRGGHGAECLGVSEVGWWQRHSVDRQVGC
jgi:hypothetical protein